MDIIESINQDKDHDRVFEELKNQELLGKNGFICPPRIPQVAPMTMMIAVGFGDAIVTKDDEIIYSESQDAEGWDDFWTTQTAENEARKDPDHEWIIDMQGPLQGRTYMRVGEDNWMLIDSNKGFA